MKVSASVFMTVSVEVYVGDWEAAQPFEQLHQQASREAVQKLARLIGGKENDFAVLRDSAVMHVITKEKKP